MVAILIAIIALVLYGSLYPWVFQANPSIGNPFLAMLHAHSDEFNRRFMADIVINLGLYVPIGLSGWLTFRRCRSRVLRGALVLLLGFALSAGVEMAQFYVPRRRTSVIDLINNTVGTGLGIGAGIAFETFLRRRRRHGLSLGLDRATLALLLTWVGSLLFPIFPVMYFLLYQEKIVHFLHPRAFDAVLFCSAIASWYAAGCMVRAISAPEALRWATVALVPAQFFIVGRQPSVVALAGAITGTVLCSSTSRVRIAAWLFLVVLVVRGLQPFHTGAFHAFEFAPFHPLLEMDWERGTRILLEKSWYFGAAIWLLTQTGTRLPRSIAVVASLATIVEVLQMWLPGRTPEITDPILAVLIGLAIYALRD